MSIREILVVIIISFLFFIYLLSMILCVYKYQTNMLLLRRIRIRRLTNMINDSENDTIIPIASSPIQLDTSNCIIFQNPDNEITYGTHITKQKTNYIIPEQTDILPPNTIIPTHIYGHQEIYTDQDIYTNQDFAQTLIDLSLADISFNELITFF